MSSHETKIQLQNTVHNAAKQGKIFQLMATLATKSKQLIEELVHTETNGAAPLVMACKYGHYAVAEYLIKECNADMEQPGSVVIDGERIEGARPLWCAAAAGHLDLVKLLVTEGAKLNSKTKTQSTPLRVACFDAHYKIAEVLVQAGADIEAASKDGHTCLMAACYRGHIGIVKCLLASKADPNGKTIMGNTALHDCAENGSLEILKILIKYGARMVVDIYGITPLLTAASFGHTHFVEHLIRIPHLVSRKEKIDALELLGATYVDQKRDMIGAIEFWERAMNERYYGDEKVIPKPQQPPPIRVYDYAVEVSNSDQLNDLLGNPDEIRMQALLIRERILGTTHPDTSYFIRRRGESYADEEKLEHTIELWNYALDLQQKHTFEPLNPMIQSLFISFIELFSYMMGDEDGRMPPAKQNDIMRVFKKAILEVKSGKEMIDKLPLHDRESLNLNRILYSTLHLACLLTHEMPKIGTEEYVNLHRALRELIQIQAKDDMGRDVLHIAHIIKSTLDYQKHMNIYKYIHKSIYTSPKLTLALLKAGADPTATDKSGNTALHLIEKSDWETDLALLLLKYGAHSDAVNNSGDTYQSLLKNKKRFNSLNPFNYITLKCLAARVIRRTQKINFDELPKHLCDFILMH